jgi:hypothetical protein
MMINGRALLAKGLTLAFVASGFFGSFAPAGASYYATAAGGDTPWLNELDSSKSEMRPSSNAMWRIAEVCPAPIQSSRRPRG